METETIDLGEGSTATRDEDGGLHVRGKGGAGFLLNPQEAARFLADRRPVRNDAGDNAWAGAHQ